MYKLALPDYAILHQPPMTVDGSSLNDKYSKIKHEERRWYISRENSEATYFRI